MGQPLVLNAGANQYTHPAYRTKKCFIAAAAAGNITTTVNRDRQAGAMMSLLLLDAYVQNQHQDTTMLLHMTNAIRLSALIDCTRFEFSHRIILHLPITVKCLEKT